MVIRNFILSLAIEFGPVVVFFLVAILVDFFAGVASLIATTLLAVLISYLRDKRLPLFSLIASFFVIVSGAATLLLRDPYWVVLEFTVYNLIFGVAMFIGYLYRRPALKPLFKTMFAITDHGWTILSLRWGIFFVLLALANEIAWRSMGYDGWVYFRFVSALIIGAFGFSQFFLARRERLPEASAWGLKIYP